MGYSDWISRKFSPSKIVGVSVTTIGSWKTRFPKRSSAAIFQDGTESPYFTIDIECASLSLLCEGGGYAAIGRNRLDYCKIAIGNAQRFVGRGELNAVAYGELAIDFLVDADACEAAGIVGGKFPIRFLATTCPKNAAYFGLQMSD